MPFFVNVLLHPWRRNRRLAKARRREAGRGLICPACRAETLHRVGDNEYRCTACGYRAGFTVQSGGRVKFGGKS